MRARPGCSMRTLPAGSSAARPADRRLAVVGDEHEPRDHGRVARQGVAAKLLSDDQTHAERRARRRAGSVEGSIQKSWAEAARRREDEDRRERGPPHRGDARESAVSTTGSILPRRPGFARARVPCILPQPLPDDTDRPRPPRARVLPAKDEVALLETPRQVAVRRETRCGSPRARRSAGSGPTTGPAPR